MTVFLSEDNMPHQTRHAIKSSLMALAAMRNCVNTLAWPPRRQMPAGLNQQGRRAVRGFGRSGSDFVDTVPTGHGSADALGDDQAQRHSAWGALDESAARQGGKHREPSRTVSDAPGLLASLAWPLAVVLLLAAIAAGWPITWPLG